MKKRAKIINRVKISNYNLSLAKKILDYFALLVMVIFFSPLIIILSVLVTLNGLDYVFFRQKRIGKNGLVFEIVKFRTMKKGAERLQKKYKSMNEADGPVFKIYNDPRFTKIGKLLSRTGLDELPQLFNVLKGEMSMVGPRPLPVEEARSLREDQKVRELVKPGITSNWVVGGSHNLSFEKWMEFDSEYVKSATLLTDLSIMWRTLVLVVGFVLKYLFF